MIKELIEAINLINRNNKKEKDKAGVVSSSQYLRSWTTLLDLDWFYDILDLDLKKTWTNLLESDWFYYNHAGMLLEKSEDLLELYVKQL